MKLSRWASENQQRLGLDDRTTDRKEVRMSDKSSMSGEEKARVIQALRDVAARNNGEPTEAERRQAAVAALAKKTPQQPPTRKQAHHPASQALVDAIRGGR